VAKEDTNKDVSPPQVVADPHDPKNQSEDRAAALPGVCQTVLGRYNALSELYGPADSTVETGEAIADASALPCERMIDAYVRLHEQHRRRTAALAAAAHELRSPLVMIAGYSDLLLSGKVGPLNPRQWQMLDEVHQHSERLRRVISDLLAYSAVETGKFTMKYILGDLNVCLAELYKFWLPRFQQEGRSFYFQRNDKLQLLRFDYEKVQHVVSNLLENALKFTPSGGTVWLETGPRFWERRKREVANNPDRRQRSVSDQPNAVRVSVADTGPGIPPEYHRDIFEAFFKVPQASNSRGMGLGLAIAQRLVHAHGGTIWVESQPRFGAKFSFLLPVDPTPQTSSNSREDKESPLRES
jgi:signal transduction histidine kinase